MKVWDKDFVNENIEMVRKLSFAMQLSHPDDYEGGVFSCWMKQATLILFPVSVARLYCLTPAHTHRVLKVTKGTRKSIVGWTVGPRWK